MGFGSGSKNAGKGVPDWGLLTIRLGVGLIILLVHGYDKLAAGPATWTKLGAAMHPLGIGFLPVFWGFMAALSESLGSVLLITGLAFRPAAALLAITMLVASLQHLNLPAGAPNAGWDGASHALELLAVYGGLLLTGPGRFSLAPGWRRG